MVLFYSLIKAKYSLVRFIRATVFISILIICNSCENPQSIIDPPSVKTGKITNIKAKSAQLINSTIELDGGGQVLARGVCWSTLPDPSVEDKFTTDGDGVGDFNSTITELPPDTDHYVRAYATNSNSTSYGEVKKFRTLDGLPILTTDTITEINFNSAKSGGNITSNGGDSILARGVCWSTSDFPTISDSNTIDSIGLGSFTSLIKNLLPNTTYFVSAYATNSIKTAYGSIKKFTTSFEPVTDIDGNIYQTTEIGDQIWIAENLKTTKYNDGTPITLITNNDTWYELTTEAYCYYGNDESSYKDEYGALYNGYAVISNKLCPIGWHVPSYEEWQVLMNYLGGTSIAGGKLKEIGTTHWSDPNTGATNEYNFTSLPGGFRQVSWQANNGFGKFGGIRSDGFWWSSGGLWFIWMLNNHSEVRVDGNSKGNGFSVRCLKD